MKTQTQQAAEIEKSREKRADREAIREWLRNAISDFDINSERFALAALATTTTDEHLRGIKLVLLHIAYQLSLREE